MASQIESILDKARKILSLAEHGTEGEMIAAKATLSALLKKYGLTIDDLNQTRRMDRKFTVKNKRECSILFHCLLKMFGRESEVTKSAYKYKHNSTIYIKMSEVEYLYFSPFFAFHLCQYRKEHKKIINTVTAAYVNKHNLFPDNDTSSNNTNIDWETLKQIMRLSQTMENVSYYKTIE